MSNIITAHTEDCFLIGKCVCKDPDPAKSRLKSRASLEDDILRLHRETRSWRNTAAVCLLFSAASVGVTALRSLGWV